MAFISLSSPNEKFSWILEKNPATQITNDCPLTRNTKSYANYLWFENDNHVSLFSKELKGAPHIKKKSKGQLDFTQHTKGEVYLQLIDSLLRTALKKENEFDTIEATLKFSIYNHNGLDYSERMPQYVKECVTKNRHSNIVIVAPSVKKALEVCTVISLLTSFHEEDYYIEDVQYLKYLAFAVQLTKEYSLLRQMTSYIRSPKLYETAKPFIDTTPFNIKVPRAFVARQNYYRDELLSKTSNTKLLEIGCGEGKYFKLHLKKYKNIVSIEPDEEPFIDATHSCRKIQAQDKITIIQTDAMSYLETIDTLYETDVLMTEVLEHISYEESMNIIDKVLMLGPDHFLITLPNFEFNKYYGYKPGEFRHDDHLWEPSITDFENIVSVIKHKHPGYELTVDFIGDSLRENPKVCATFALIMKKV